MISTPFPDPTIFEAGTGEPSLRWAILGSGRIAHAFVKALRTTTNQRIVSVASRSLPRAEAFASAYNIGRSHDSYEAALAGDVDVAYIATPTSQHLELGLLATGAGRHVLIEKPLTATPDDAKTLREAAARAHVLLMEGMWTRYLPQTSVIRRLIADGALGTIRQVAADHGQPINPWPDHPLSQTGDGGVLLDLGIYPVQFSSMVLGGPSRITARGSLSATGVEQEAAVVLEHEAGSWATITTSMLTRTANTAFIAGSEGMLSVDGNFYSPTSMHLASSRFRTPTATWTDPTGVTSLGALAWEANALAGYVGQGRTESPLHDLDETVRILDTVAEARRQVLSQVR